MAGNVEGGKKVAAKLLAKDPDHYTKMGRAGGLRSRGGGFSGPGGQERARRAGAIGGRASSRAGVRNARVIPEPIESQFLYRKYYRCRNCSSKFPTSVAYQAHYIAAHYEESKS